MSREPKEIGRWGQSNAEKPVDGPPSPPSGMGRRLVRDFRRRHLAPWASLPLALLLLLQGSAATAAPLSAAERAQLARGEVLSRTLRLGQNIARGEAIGVIAASPAATFAVIADVARYKDLFERIVKSEVVGRNAKGYLFAYTIDMPWPLADYHCVTKNIHHTDPQRGVYERRWSLVSGTFLRNEGYWRVEPWDKTRALVFYSASVRPKTSVPDFVVRFAAKKALPKAIKALRKRVAELQRRGARGTAKGASGT